MTQMSHLKLLNSLSILQECTQFNRMASNYAPNGWDSNQNQQPILNAYHGQKNHYNLNISHAAVEYFDPNGENNYNSGNLPVNLPNFLI